MRLVEATEPEVSAAVCLHWASRAHGRGRVFAFAVNYGQRHRCELVSARQIASDAGVELVVRTIAIPLPRHDRESGQRALFDTSQGELSWSVDASALREAV